MSDIRREETPVSLLAIGMYVCELDRPWLGTPFLLEGILIESDEDIASIAAVCSYVYVDRTMSVGHHFVAPAKRDTAIKRDGVVVNINMRQSFDADKKQTPKRTSISPPEAKLSFFEILKEIKQTNADAKLLGGGVSASKASSNASKTKLSDRINAEDSNDDNPTTLKQHFKNDIKNLVASFGFGTLRNKNKKLNNGIDKEALENAIQAEMNQQQTGDDRVYVYQNNVDVEVEIAQIYEVYEQSQIATKALYESLANGDEIDITLLDEPLNQMVASIERSPDALMWLAKLKQTDDYAYNHAMNVSIMLMALANFMALPKKQIKDLGIAGLLQDIGKAKISKDLLHKAGKLSPEEYKIIQTHVDHALAMIEVTESITSTVILTVSQHHERFNGSGYPYQLKNKQISLTGQMAGLIDTYCALTTDRPYAKGLYNQLALEEIHAMRDEKFQGALIDQLVQFLGIYPVSSLVELNSGEVGVVIQQNSVRRLLPKVMVLLNPDKTKNKHPATLDLITAPLTPIGEPYKIVRGLPPESFGLDFTNFYG